jgi:hypothetical protein
VAAIPVLAAIVIIAASTVSAGAVIVRSAAVRAGEFYYLGIKHRGHFL